QIEAATEALEDLPRREHLYARGGELERERKPVEPLGDATHRGVGLEAGLELSCALREECRRVFEWERRHRKLLLGRDVEPASAGGEDARVAPRDDARGFREQLLQVVEHEQRPLARQEVAEIVGSADNPRDRRLDQLRVPYRGERDEPHAIAVLLDA